MVERIYRTPTFRADTPQRTGITVDHVNFPDQPLGYFESKLLGRWAGQPGSRAHKGILINFDLQYDSDAAPFSPAKYIHQLNEQAKPAPVPFLPDPEVRERDLKVHARTVDVKADELAGLELEYIQEGLELAPFDFKNLSLADAIDLMDGRATLRAMNPETRNKALDQDRALRMAALKHKSPYTSGLTAESWQHLWDRALREEKPEVVARRRDEAVVIREVKRTIEALRRGLTAEATSLSLMNLQRGPAPRPLPPFKPAHAA